MIYIDPSELRETSNLLKYISDVIYVELPGLEAKTGADLMITPDGLPSPITQHLLKLNVESGSKLIQLKFGHDLPLSITDGRLNEALSRMQRYTFNSWQCLLIFVGTFDYDNTDHMAVINGQLTYGHYPMKWKAINNAINKWIDRGGAYSSLSSGKQLPLWLANIQANLKEYASGKKTKEIYEKTSKHWNVAQKLIIIDDLRSLLCAIPSARIGPERATAIFGYMADRKIRQDLIGFLYLVHSGELMKVAGIGPKILKDIKRGLFMTEDERSNK